MQRILTCFIVTASMAVPFFGNTSWAQDNTEGGGGTVAPTTTTDSRHVGGDAFDSALSVTPRVGSFGYESAQQTYDSRIIEGITANVNLASVMSMRAGWNLGIESGVLYSHIGSFDANWFGTNSSAVTTEGANMYLIPITAQIGYRPTDSTLVALNLGAQLLVRTAGNSMALGRPGDTSTGSESDFFPSVGLNLGWDLGRAAGLSLRGDAIPTPSAVSYSAMLGLTFGLV